jgi:hypothetical protein
MGDQRFLDLCVGNSECNLKLSLSRALQPPTTAPIIVIFTKYDLLISKFEKELYAEENQDMTEGEFEELVDQKASEFFEQVCVKPLKNAMDITEEDGTIKSIPYAFISSKLLVLSHLLFSLSDPAKPRYQYTLSKLVDLSQRYIDKQLWIIWSVAQVASVDLKIEASIEYASSFLISSPFLMLSVTPPKQSRQKECVFQKCD